MRCKEYLILIVFMAASAPLLAANRVGHDADRSVGTVRDRAMTLKPAQVSPVPPRPSRLRFRSGPVCMCSGGLSEAQISAAERTRNKQANSSIKSLKNIDK